MLQENKKTDSISFYQIITVIIFLIIAVTVKAINKETYESLRLKYVNMIGDKGGYNEIVYPASGEENKFSAN